MDAGRVENMHLIIRLYSASKWQTENKGCCSKKTCVKEHIDTLTKTNGDLWGAN